MFGALRQSQSLNHCITQHSPWASWTTNVMQRYGSKTPSASDRGKGAFSLNFLSIHIQHPKVAAVSGVAKAKKIQSWDEAIVNRPAKSVAKNCIPNRV